MAVQRIRLPNKALITTRFREFKADYPVEVGGMTEDEFRVLVDATARQLGLAGSLFDAYAKELYEESDGHPYVAKILLGEAAIQGGRRKVKRVLAAKEDVLDALFVRTFELLPPGGQRVFLTLCNWRSHIPRLAIEAALIRPSNDRIDVTEALDILQRSSLVQTSVSPHGEEWLSVPLAAHLFGQRKLRVSPMKTAIDTDTDPSRLRCCPGHRPRPRPGTGGGAPGSPHRGEPAGGYRGARAYPRA